MNVATMPVGWSRPPFASLALGALRDLRWSQIGAALLLGLVVDVWSETVFVRFLVSIASSMQLGVVMLGNLIGNELSALSLLVAIVIADRAVEQGAPRRRSYALAALAGCLLAAIVNVPFDWVWHTRVFPDPWPEHMSWLRYPTRLYFMLIMTTTHWLLIGGAVVFLYADRRAARKTAQLLQDAELDRIRRSRLALEARLQAMQARVEPEFLLDTLRHVRQVYELDPALAARVLDDLIDYLRAAMPVMRDTSSTLGQELQLIGAYLDIACLRAGTRLAATVAPAPDGEPIRMPPMLLLPLVVDAVRRRMESDSDGAIGITTEVSEGRLRLTVADRGGESAMNEQSEGFTRVGQRLHALYGGNATLVSQRGDDRFIEAILDLPLGATDAMTDAWKQQRFAGAPDA